MGDNASIPMDSNSNAIQLVPAKSRARTVNTSGLSSATSVVTLDEKTRFVRMYAVGGDVAVSFRGTVSTTDFDHIIPAGGIVDVASHNGPFQEEVVSAIVFSGTNTSFTVIEY